MQIETTSIDGNIWILKKPTPTRSQKYLRMLEEKYALKNQNQVANHLGVNRVAARRWYLGEQNFSDEVAVKVAQELEIDPLFILAEMQAERTKGSVKNVWEETLKKWIEQEKASALASAKAEAEVWRKRRDSNPR